MFFQNPLAGYSFCPFFQKWTERFRQFNVTFPQIFEHGNDLFQQALQHFTGYVEYIVALTSG